MKVIFREAEFKDIESIIKLCDEVFEEKTDLNYAKKLFLILKVMIIKYI